MSTTDDRLGTDERIAWILAHPRMSSWLKDTLRGARTRDPIEVLNELEILVLLLRSDCEARIERDLPCQDPPARSTGQ